VITGPIPRRYLVTGCGDGALIDAARLRIRDFDHARFVSELLEDDSLSPVKKALLRIDRDAAEVRKDPEIGSRMSPQEIVEYQSVYLYKEYEALDLPEKLCANLRNRLRQDTVVTLNCPESTPLSLRASVPNRFIVFLLRKHGGLRFIAGTVSITPGGSNVSRQVVFHRDGHPDEKLEVEEVVVRHGVESEIEKLVPKTIREQLRHSGSLEDPTLRPCYPKDFLNNAVWQNVALKVRRKYAISNFAGASAALFQVPEVKRVGLDVDNDEIRYRVATSNSDAKIRLREYASIPVVLVEYILSAQAKSNLYSMEVSLRLVACCNAIMKLQTGSWLAASFSGTGECPVLCC